MRRASTGTTDASRSLARTHRPRASRALWKLSADAVAMRVFPPSRQPGMVPQEQAHPGDESLEMGRRCSRRPDIRSAPTGVMSPKTHTPRRPPHAASCGARRHRLGSADRGHPRSAGPLNHRPRTVAVRRPARPSRSPAREFDGDRRKRPRGPPVWPPTGPARRSRQLSRQRPMSPYTRRSAWCYGASKLALPTPQQGRRSETDTEVPTSSHLLPGRPDRRETTMDAVPTSPPRKRALLSR